MGKKSIVALLGEQHRQCSVCGFSRREVVPMGDFWHHFGVTVLLHRLCGEPAESAMGLHPQDLQPCHPRFRGALSSLLRPPF